MGCVAAADLVMMAAKILKRLAGQRYRRTTYNKRLEEQRACGPKRMTLGCEKRTARMMPTKPASQKRGLG